MTYHPLTTESGGDEQSRVNEARTIVRLLEEFSEQLSSKEQNMVESMADCDSCTTKQLFYLRDIKDRYL